MRQLVAEPVVILVEILGKEEMTVGIVVVGLDVEFRALHTSLGGNSLRFRVLLRHQTSKVELAELQLCLETEQCGSAADQTRPGGHADITGLQVLDNLILLTLIVEFKILGIERECGVGVVVHVELQLVADRSIDGGLDFLIEVKICLSAVLQRKRRIVGLVALDTG